MEVKWKMVIRWQYRRCYKGIGQNEEDEGTGYIASNDRIDTRVGGVSLFSRQAVSYTHLTLPTKA